MKLVDAPADQPTGAVPADLASLREEYRITAQRFRELLQLLERAQVLSMASESRAEAAERAMLKVEGLSRQVLDHTKGSAAASSRCLRLVHELADAPDGTLDPHAVQEALQASRAAAEAAQAAWRRSVDLGATLVSLSLVTSREVAALAAARSELARRAHDPRAAGPQRTPVT